MGSENSAERTGKLSATLMNDVAFKQFFQIEPNLRVLLHHVLKIPSDDIVKITYTDKEIVPDLIENKSVVFDINVILELKIGASLVGFEMQIDLLRDSYADRSVYSLTRLHGEALKKGEKYESVRKTMYVHFLDGVLFPDEPFHATASMRFDESKNQVNDKLNLHYIQLGKFNKKLSEIDENDTENLIYKLFKAKTWEELRTMESVSNETVRNLAYNMTVIDGDPLAIQRERLLDKARYAQMVEREKKAERERQDKERERQDKEREREYREREREYKKNLVKSKAEGKAEGKAERDKLKAEIEELRRQLNLPKSNNRGFTL
jgi:predicted transposase/invertase (TIGR01784 family)